MIVDALFEIIRSVLGSLKMEVGKISVRNGLLQFDFTKSTKCLQYIESQGANAYKMPTIKLQRILLAKI